MGLRFHADDIGLSAGITDGILHTIDHGVVKGVSLVPNGWDFDRAVAALLERPSVVVSVHLNLIEAPPLSPASDIPDLVDRTGQLAAGFASLWSRWVCSGRLDRRRLQDQIARELDQQIARVVRAFSGHERKLRLDSHQHLHMLPFIFELLPDLCQRHGLVGIRIPQERPSISVSTLPGILGINLVKLALLNELSAAIPIRDRLPGHERFIGVLMTGRQTDKSVIASLGALARDQGNGDAIEVLLHPGRARPDENALWNGRPRQWRYYRSRWRDAEARVLTGPELRAYAEAS